MRDCIGREIKRGSYVVYPGRQSSVMWVTFGIVLSVTDRPTPLGRCGPPMEPVLKVQALDRHTRKTIGKPATLSRIDLVTVVDDPDYAGGAFKMPGPGKLTTS